MEYFLSFLEGVITFISPCLLPMLPIYIFYFTAGKEDNKKGAFVNSIFFVLGFTVVFTILGAFAGVVGGFLKEYQKILNIVSGGIVIVFGLNYLGVFNIGILNRNKTTNKSVKITGIFSAFIFGVLFSVSWMPCVGAFLSSALMKASQKGTIKEGVLMLVLYSIGLGIPFILSAVLIENLKGTFNFIKKHYNIINKISGVFLILMGVLMATGYLGYILSFLSFL